MKKATKLLLVAISLALIVGVAVGGTIAWLLDTTPEVVNTFTTTNIDITLTEEEGGTNKEFEMVPGNTIAKDPVVTVIEGSEPCYVFIEVVKSKNLDTYITYTLDSKWKALGDAYPNIYYYEGVVDASEADQVLQILAGKTNYVDGYVTVNNTVTNQLMDEAKTNKPTLTFKAYACQEANVADPVTAWGYASAAGVPVYGN